MTAILGAVSLPLAHAGHWLVQVVYFLPVIAFLIWLAVTQLRERRNRGEDGGGKSADVR